MEGLKNMIVVKNIPSNIVEEAFIIVKENLKIEKLDIDKKNENKLIIKEAEDIIQSCESLIEKNEENNKIKKREKKCKRLKMLTGMLGVLAILGTFINFF